MGEQIHEVMELLQTAEKQAKQVTQRMRKERLSFAPTSDHIDEDLTRLIKRLRYMERVAQHHEVSEEQRAKKDPSSDDV